MCGEEACCCWSWRARAVVEWVVVARKRKRDVRGFLRMGDMVISFFLVLDLATLPSEVRR